MTSGWVCLHRKLSMSDLWTDEPFTRGQAWVDLIMLARHKPGFRRIRGQRVDVGRGCLAWSESALADRWHWSRGKVRRFIRELETEQQIVQQKNNVCTVISVVNYGEYQTGGTPNGTAGGTADGTTDGPQTVQRYNNGKHEDNDKQGNIAPSGEPEQTAFVDVDDTLPIDFILKDGSAWQPKRSKLPQWQKAYPLIDVEYQLGLAAAWTIDNVSKRKTARGMGRYIGNWLSNATKKTGITDTKTIERVRRLTEEYGATRDEAAVIASYKKDLMSMLEQATSQTEGMTKREMLSVMLETARPGSCPETEYKI